MRRQLEKRRKPIALGILCLGLAAALVVYARATPPADDADEWPAHSKQYLHQMELYGGKANVLANDAREWFDSLWHGKRLAFTLAFLSMMSAGLTLLVLTPLGDRRATPMGASDYGPCRCCGGRSRRVWGEIVAGERTEAVYYVHWTLGQVDRHGAHFDLVVGSWGDGTSAADRKAVSLEFRRTERGPEFMVIDATRREVASSNLVGRALDRPGVIGTPLASQVFGIVDSIWVGDPRIRELR